MPMCSAVTTGDSSAIDEVHADLRLATPHLWQGGHRPPPQHLRRLPLLLKLPFEFQLRLLGPFSLQTFLFARLCPLLC